MRVSDALRGVNRLFLDTAPVIYHVERAEAYRAVAQAIFEQIEHGIVQGVTSSVTLAECLVQPYVTGDMELIDTFRDVITNGVNTLFAGIDGLGEQAAELRARYNLSLTDAFQVAAAVNVDCEAILTNDKGLRRVQEIRVIILDELEVDSSSEPEAGGGEIRDVDV